MNSDKSRLHRPMQGTSAFPWEDDALRDFQFGCTGTSRAADGGSSGRRRTGRKEKPYQDNREKPKCAKFHRREANLTRDKPRQDAVANTLNSQHDGAVGFIDWLGIAGRRGKVWSQPCAARKVTTLPPPADSYDYRSSEPKAKCGG